MTSMIAKVALAALISLGAISTTAATASAGGVDVYVDVRGPAYHRDYRHRGQCNPYRAVEKARWQGLHRAHVTHVGRHRVVVEGRRHHRFDRIVFANVRGCPVIHR